MLGALVALAFQTIPFDSTWEEWGKRMDSASKLIGVPMLISDQHPLTPEQCLEISNAIASHHRFNPFVLDIVGGKIQNPICTKRATHVYFDQKLLTHETLASYEYHREIELTEDLAPLEWKELWISRKDPTQQFHFHAQIDEEGNIFTHFWNDDVTDVRKKIKGPFHKTTFISATGMTPEPWSLVGHTDSMDPQHQRKLKRISNPTAIDWNDVFVPLTFFKSGGVYQYENQLHKLPRNFVSIRVYELDGQRQCVVGSESVNGKIKLIPEDFTQYSECVVQ